MTCKQGCQLYRYICDSHSCPFTATHPRKPDPQGKNGFTWTNPTPEATQPGFGPHLSTPQTSEQEICSSSRSRKRSQWNTGTSRFPPVISAHQPRQGTLRAVRTGFFSSHLPKLPRTGCQGWQHLEFLWYLLTESSSSPTTPPAPWSITPGFVEPKISREDSGVSYLGQHHRRRRRR